MIPFAVRRAKKVIAVSQSTKSDLMRLLRVPGRKVEVVYEAAAKRTPPKKYSVERPYILFVGMLEPRKNIPRLLEAFARLPDAYDLIIVGKKGWKFDQVFATHNRLSLRGRVHFEGYASDTRLAQLYANASVFVYPSLYEGFGLPVLEAMQAGCPVITSNISSLPEVAGDAAILVDPYSVKSITDALYTVLSNKSLQRDLIIKGKKQAKKFSWKKAAKETLEVFEQCVKK